VKFRVKSLHYLSTKKVIKSLVFVSGGFTNIEGGQEGAAVESPVGRAFSKGLGALDGAMSIYLGTAVANEFVSDACEDPGE